MLSLLPVPIICYSRGIGSISITLCLLPICFNAVWRGKKVHINTFETPFLEVWCTFFDELEDEVTPARPLGETTYERIAQSSNDKASTWNIHFPQSMWNIMRKLRARQEEKLCENIKLPTNKLPIVYDSLGDKILLSLNLTCMKAWKLMKKRL